MSTRYRKYQQSGQRLVERFKLPIQACFPDNMPHDLSHPEYSGAAASGMTVLVAPSYRQAWSLSWPVMLANLSVPLAGAVDTAVVGHLPNVALIGAVGIGALVFGFLYWTFAFLRMGTTGFVAQDYGAGDNRSVHDTATRALVLGGLVSLLLLIFQGPLALGFFHFIAGEPEVEEFARAYYDVRIWGAPAALTNFVVLGVLFGLQRMRAALVTQLVLNTTNIVLDIGFVFGLGWGVEGVAAATIISEYLAAGLGLLLVRSSLPGFGTTFVLNQLFDGKAIRSMIEVSFDLMVRTVLVTGVFLHFTSLSAEYGKVILAVNTILNHYFHFLSYGLDGFAHAVEALGGNAYGKRDKRAFDQAVRSCTAMSVLIALIFMLVYWAAGEPLFSLMTDSEEVREVARDYLVWMIVMPLIGVWSFLLDGIFVGTTRSAEMRNAMIVSVIAYALAVFAVPTAWGNHGLWATITIFMIVRALSLAALYPRIQNRFD